MTWKQIEASREARLWIERVFMPCALIGCAIVYGNPETREKCKSKMQKTKEKIKNVINKW